MQELRQPQCIVIVDASGVTLGQLRMRGARFLSLASAEAKARTAQDPKGTLKQLMNERQEIYAQAQLRIDPSNRNPNKSACLNKHHAKLCVAVPEPTPIPPTSTPAVLM
ncbi:heme-binding protein (plasmid) [Sinorhizobium garamanticum]|uniref:Heme-binding protein n=1 Tax=Sinorhizobium garamanticum TaxID=680247 RepID=A0ABY8DKR1_9HYPH|nr:heme-binding protein [Sinorhizobium garamanticum]WEX91499.1 heme-binding protein [Sinorhizobium garamanticum]